MRLSEIAKVVKALRGQPTRPRRKIDEFFRDDVKQSPYLRSMTRLVASIQREAIAAATNTRDEGNRMRVDTRSKAYEMGEERGYSMAVSERATAMASDDLGTDAANMLIRELGPYSAGKTLGVTLYANGRLTQEGEDALRNYGYGAAAGWNRYVNEKRRTGR